MSIWLTRVNLPKDFLESRLEGRVGKAYSLFKDDYAAHKASWEFFPGSPDSKRTFLTRLMPEGEVSRFFILSDMPPVRPGWCPEHLFDVKEISENFLKHEFYRFDLFANPTRMTHPEGRSDPRKNGKRQALLKEEEQLGWILRKAADNGFSVEPDTLLIDKPMDRYFYKNGIRGNHVGVRFRGILKVTDQQLFNNAFTKGIGTAKGFGFGMLVLQPVY